MYRLSRVCVDKVIGGLKAPLNKVFMNPCHRLSKILSLDSALTDMYSDMEIGEQEFKSTVERWIAYGVDKD